MTQPSRRLALAAVVVLGLLPFVLPLLRGEIFTMRDHSDYFVPLRYFTAQSLRAGDLPLWNAYNGSGEPWLANPQTAIFYPPAAIFLLASFASAYILFLAFHVVLLGVGCLLLFRRCCSPPAALAGAVIAMLGGPTLSFLDVNNNLATFAWLPLLLWIATAAPITGRRVGIPAGIVLALMFLAGEPYLAFLSAITCAVVLFVRRAAIQVAIAGAVAAGLSAVQLLPFLSMLAGSDRTAGLPRDLAFAESLAPFDWAVAALSPLASPTHILVGTQTFIPSLYLGPAAFFGLFLLVFSLGPHRDALPIRPAIGFAAMFAGFAILAAGAYLPWLAEAMIRSGVAVSRHASRVAPLAALALAGLAAIGFDRLRDAAPFARIAAAAATLAVTAIAAARVVPFARVDGFRSLLLPAALLAIVLIAGVARPRFAQRSWILLLGSALIAIDLVAGSSALLKTDRFTPSVPEYASAISSDRRLLRLEESQQGRVFRLDRHAWYAGYLNLLDRKYDVSTPAPVVSSRYLRLQDAVIAQARLDVADFLSAAYIATSRTLEGPSLAPLKRIGSVNLYLNRGAWPMVTLWREFHPAKNSDEALRMIESRSVDIRRAPIVVSPPDDLGHSLAGSGAAFDARMWYELKANRAEARVRTTQPVILAFSQTWAKGWSVSIDGAAAAPLRINALFLGALVPAGDHVIAFTYRTPYLLQGAAVSLASLCAVIALLATARRRTSA